MGGWPASRMAEQMMAIESRIRIGIETKNGVKSKTSPGLEIRAIFDDKNIFRLRIFKIIDIVMNTELLPDGIFELRQDQAVVMGHTGTFEET
ncbi:hypothetical protein EVAR_60421_1 [Eumeta japonica]|uniref:Uncharacterized protein n=1 Tax=Eumeta variegata TaxID=151549 RepID=A0A4C1ZLA0_EUMVA|nr:hypothetical protein EVAR_60421_1 [Eumeta japonica]